MRSSRCPLFVEPGKTPAQTLEPFLVEVYRPVDEAVPDTPLLLMEPGAPEPMPVVPTALLGRPMSVRFAGESPSLGPLLPVVLPLSELPVVVELAACPPES